MWWCSLKAILQQNINSLASVLIGNTLKVRNGFLNLFEIMASNLVRSYNYCFWEYKG